MSLVPCQKISVCVIFHNCLWSGIWKRREFWKIFDEEEFIKWLILENDNGDFRFLPFFPPKISKKVADFFKNLQMWKIASLNIVQSPECLFFCCCHDKEEHLTDVYCCFFLEKEQENKCNVQRLLFDLLLRERFNVFQCFTFKNLL